MTTSYIQDTAEERISSKFDYKVERVPLVTADGLKTRFFGTKRCDTNEVFATVTEQYEIVQNEELFATAESLFNSMGLPQNRKTVVTHGGARARAIYTFPTMGTKVKKDDLHFRLIAQNSFDGSLRASFQVGMFRLVCSNGLVSPVSAVSLVKKHTSGLDKDFVRRAIEISVDSFQKSAVVFEAMTNIRLSQNDGTRILENLSKRAIVSERMAKDINAIWENPTHQEDRERNLWSLYNASTQHLTHNVADKRFELAERVNGGIMNELVKATRQGSIAHLLVSMQ